MLLSDRAIAYSKPNLEILADDVKASHGATVGQLDENELFYLQSRGLPKKEAHKLLVQAFAETIFKNISLKSLLKKLKHECI